MSLRFTRQAWPQLPGWPKSRPAGTTTPSHRHLPARPTGTASPPGPGRPWLWRFGGHRPSLEAGSGRLGLRDPGGESPPPWTLLALALPSGLHAPRIPILPFRGGLLPVGESRGRPSPQVVPRPPGRETQGKPVRAFLATAQRQRVRAPQGVRGPPPQPFPLVLARSPPLPRHGFRRPLARSNAALRHRVLPTANARPSSPPPRLRTTRGEVPALERGTRTFPPSRPRRPLSRPFPLRGSGARGTPAREAGQDPRRGARRREGVAPSPVRPSYRGPPCWQGGRPGRSPPWAYALASA